MKLQPWRLSGILTETRTYGQVGFRFNGSFVDIWIRVSGGLNWFAVDAQELKGFLSQWDEDSWHQVQSREIILCAESDGNAEEEVNGSTNLEV